MSEPPLGRLYYDGRGLPRGRSSLAPPDVGAAHRDRLTHAVIGVVAHRGYAATTVSHVVAAARVSRAAFYAQFTGKEECFLAACFQGLGLMARSIGERVAAAPADPPDEILRATVGGLLQFLVAEPAFARCFLIEMPLAGDEARVEEAPPPLLCLPGISRNATDFERIGAWQAGRRRVVPAARRE